MDRLANSYTISLGLSPALSATDTGVTEKMPAPRKLEADTASAPKIGGRWVTSSGPTHKTIALLQSMLGFRSLGGEPAAIISDQQSVGHPHLTYASCGQVN